MRRTLALAALAVALSGPASAQRLPKLAAPVSYRIALAPDLAKGDLTGDETIVVRIAIPTKTIVLNSVGPNRASANSPTILARMLVSTAVA